MANPTAIAFKQDIEVAMIRNGIRSKSELARQCNIPYSTLHPKINNPNLLTVEELRVLISVLNLDEMSVGKFLQLKSRRR